MMVGGKLERVEDLDLYRPVDFDGKVLRLHYARAEGLKLYLGMVAAQGEVYVQVWLRPGDSPVELSLKDDERYEVIPRVLRRHL
jgi:inner membrane protein